MRNRSGRRAGWAAAGALAVVAGAPGLAEAQQTGLFPLAPIRRERVPCPAEDPVYKLYRQQYFGYHPTQWRRFPSGWGVPSPEAPNPEQSFRENPPIPPGGAGRGPEMDPNEPESPDAMPGEPGMNKPPGRGDEALPPLPPSTRSLFNPNDDRPPTPRDNTPPPPDEPPPTNPRGGSAMEAAPSIPAGTTAESGPAPLDAPAAGGSSASADAPLLALPDPTVPPNANGPTAYAPTAPAPTAAGPPVQAPRRGLLGGLFNNFSLLRR